MENKNGITKRIIKGVAVTVFWLAAWQVLSMIVAQKLLLVSPVDTAVRLWELLSDSGFLISAANSIIRIFAGFLSAVIVGTLLATVSHAVPFIGSLLSPVLSVLKATPVASFTLLLFLWIDGELLSTFIAFSMVLPIVYFGVYQGIGSADKNLLEMADVFKVGTLRKITGIYVPATIPFAVSAISVAMGFSWKSGIAAEVICIANNTLGGLLYNAKIILESTDVFAYTAVIIVISKLFELVSVALLKKLERKVKK